MSGNTSRNSPPETNPTPLHPLHPLSQLARSQLPATPPPPPGTQYNYEAHLYANQNVYPTNQYQQSHYFNNNNGNYHLTAGQFGNGHHQYAYPYNNYQHMSNQENLILQQITMGDLIKSKNKQLELKDRKIEELLAKVASLEAVSQENDDLRAKLQEFGDMETKKQDLDVQEFNLEITKLEKEETENVKEQLERSEHSKLKTEEMVRMWESCYYRDMDYVLKQNDEKLQAQRASDETNWKRELHFMARKHEEEKKKIKKELEEFKLKLKTQSQ